MRNKRFFNLDHAANYLLEGIIRFKDMPIYIVGVDAGRHGKNFTISYYELGDRDKKAHSILSDNSDIDMNPVPLGLISHVSNISNKFNTGMVMRSPQRRYKVGLTSRNSTVYDVDQLGKYPNQFRGSLGNFILSEELKNTILGIYPTLDQIVNHCRKTNTVKAFARKWATDGENLYYKAIGVPVGRLSNGSCKLNDNCSYLKEVFTEEIKNAHY